MACIHLNRYTWPAYTSTDSGMFFETLEHAFSACCKTPPHSLSPFQKNGLYNKHHADLNRYILK